MSTDPLAPFHPAVRAWFAKRFPEGPTEAQRLGWGSIADGSDTLIAAPTGSGKTLAAFLVAIDRCLRANFASGERPRATTVLYVSPLRALTVDVAENLQRPLAEIGEIAAALGLPVPEVRVAVRNGDTPPHARAAMVRDRPEIVVTTPESLYLLLTARRGRELLETVETVIVDEIHAVARDKRGSHLALSLERLDRLIEASGRPRPVRIGCSATQRPIDTVARLLVGSSAGRDTPDGGARCAVVDVGHARALDLSICLASDELGAVSSNDQLDEVVGMIAAEVQAHRTTLVFVNTRRMSERIAHLLTEHLGEDLVAAHHGSLSMRRRLSVEDRLRSGALRAVVATASLELGIDIGPVDLVCQIGSPRAIATFLQRVGRAEHRVRGVGRARVYPMTRDELVECTALFGAVRAGRLDAVVPPVAPLDILAQQMVAEVAASGEDGISESELYQLVRGAAPYAALGEDDFQQVLALMADGVTTGRGQRGAYLHRDRVNGVVRARRGARLAAATSGGAIPELADYTVLVEPEAAVVGSVHEDFAMEAMIGDVFLLAGTSWRVLRVAQGTVHVLDAQGAAPTIPFWLGEAPARTEELSLAISALRVLVADALDAGGPASAIGALCEWSGVSERAASEVVAYLATAKIQLGVLPTHEHLVFERFFDDAGGMQLVVHCPYGARVNRGLGLALRKRFCRSFDFELQAAANDDAIVLSLGPQHSFALEEVSRFLSPDSVLEVLTQAVLPTPIFTSRWRWNLGRSLIAPRFRGARHVPPAIQRMEADDLMASIFPALAACQENVTGPIEIPDHPIVRQTLADCFSEAMDGEALVGLVGGIRRGEIAVTCVDSVEACVLSHEILNGRPFTYLDDAPLEERRTRAVNVARGIPLEARDLSQLDPAIITEVLEEVAVTPVDAEDLHDLLLSVVLAAPTADTAHFAHLVAAGRAMAVERDGAPLCWCATEWRAGLEAAFPQARFTPSAHLAAPGTVPEPDALVATMLRGHLAMSAPGSATELAARLSLGEGAVASALAALEARGAVLRIGDERWWSKQLVARVHARQRNRARARIVSVSVADYTRFLLDWQHVVPQRRLVGTHGLAAVIDQLQGFEAPVAAWEESILPARVSGYRPAMLDELAAQGALSWARLGLRPDEMSPRGRRAGTTPSRATPVSLVRRDDLSWLLAAARLDARPIVPDAGAAAEVLEALQARGALFFSDLTALTGRLPLEVADALWDGVARGLVTSDGFAAVRTLLLGRYRAASAAGRDRPRAPVGRLRSLARPAVPPALAGGRWSAIAPSATAELEPDELAEAVAAQLLERWGVVVRELAMREQLALPWREVLWALRRLEARGVVQGGRFVAGPLGEQFALPEAVTALHRVANTAADGSAVTLSPADPLNLTGILLPGPRVPARRGNHFVLVDGLPAGGPNATSARPTRSGGDRAGGDSAAS